MIFNGSHATELLRNCDKNAEKRRANGFTNVTIFNRMQRMRRFKDWSKTHGEADIEAFKAKERAEFVGYIPKIDLMIGHIANSNLEGIDFRGIAFHHVHFECVNFARAKFRGAELEYISASGCCFKDADLRCVRFYSFQATDSDFGGADLRGVYWRASERENAVMSRFFSSNGNRFANTLITPCQKDLMVRDLGISENDIEGRFVVQRL